MSLIDIKASTTSPTDWTESVGTTWTECQMPPWAGKVTVQFEGGAGYVAFAQTGLASPETPTDGGAVGTHRFPVGADVPLELPIRPRSFGSDRDALAPSSVFVAAQSGTIPVSVLVERT